ncbi:MAG: Ig-like domain-containing protein [Saprospiraceae bacterium]|nr:Ig-like domain-containing protein [Saprospiraceae bacterium]
MSLLLMRYHLLSFTLSFYVLQSVNAQVTDVKYLIKYNPNVDLFDCYLVIEAGTATTVVQRTQFNAQLSVVVPTGTRLHVEQNYWPRVQNQNYNSTQPINWNRFLLVKASAECPENDYYSIFPSLAPTSQYNNLAAGDTVKLFSLTIDTLKGCASEIRLFENETDISPDNPCAQQVSLNNGFTMGGIGELYRGNVIQSIVNYAGDDETVCRNTSLLLDGNTLENARWRLLSGHLGDVTLDSLNPLQAEASFLQNSSGTYNFSFGNDQVSDFKCVTINVPTTDPPGPITLCHFSTTPVSPSIGGMWSSSDTTFVSVSNFGTITALSPGHSFVTYIENSSGCSSDKISVTVHEKPVISLQGLNNICVGYTTNFIPSSGGTWASGNPSVATITNAGLVTGVGPGTTNFTYTLTSTGCISNPSVPITIHPIPTVILTSHSEICVGSTTTFSASTSGIWSSSNSSVATISNSGLVTGVAPGTATFTFSTTNGNCVSLPSQPIKVHSLPTVQFVGQNIICVGDTTWVAPGMGGTWGSKNHSIAQVSNNGRVYAVSSGTVQLVFTEIISGCTSNPLSLTVMPSPIVSISKDTLEINKSVTLSPNTGGNWYTADTNINNIIGNTFARGIGVGEATLYFQDSISGCKSKAIKLTVAEPFFTIVGYTFVDTNGNGLFDSQTDSPLPNCAIFIPELNTTFYTDKTGYYTILVDKASYTATFTVPFGEWIQNTLSKSINVNNPIEYLFAGFQPTNQGSGGLVTINSSFLKCNSQVDLDVTVFNNTSQKQSGYLAISIDNKSYVVSSIPFPSGSAGNTIFWEYLNLLPGHTFTPKIVVDVPMPETEYDSLTFHGFLLDQSGDTMTQFIYSDIIDCNTTTGGILSWPDRPGSANATYRNENLDYQIRIENTTGTAINNAEVIVKLDHNIDVSSILIKECSHPVRTFLINDSFHFVFDNIELSGKGLPNSGNAYLSFNCAFNKDVPDGTQIKNTAFIILDSNPIFQTNESINTIVSAPCVTDEVKISICPGESYASTQQIYDQPGIYIETIQGNTGCDTLRSINLSYHPVPSDSLTSHGNMLMSSAGGIQYFWYECTTNVLISTTTVPFLTPDEDGTYYVIVEGEFCNTKTACVDFIRSSVHDAWQGDIKVFPNPAYHAFTIQSSYLINYMNIRNIMGQIKMSQSGGSTSIDINHLENGIYILEIKTDKGNYITKLIKR